MHNVRMQMRFAEENARRLLMESMEKKDININGQIFV